MPMLLVVDTEHLLILLDERDLLDTVEGILLEGSQALLVQVAHRLSHGVLARVLVLEVEFWSQLPHLPGFCDLGAATNSGTSSNLIP